MDTTGSSRSFTIVTADVALPSKDSRFMAKQPYRAAVKATRALFKATDAKKRKQIRFTITETTRGSSGKSFTYIGTCTKLDTPQVIERGGKTITIEHTYSVKSCATH